MNPRIEERIRELRLAISSFKSGGASSREIQKVENLLTETEQLYGDLTTRCEPGGGPDHPLGPRPFDMCEVLFRLDLLETFLAQRLSRPKTFTGKEKAYVFPSYPSISCTVQRRCIAFLLYVRGLLLGYDSSYDHPTVREILYLKAPEWAEPFFRRLLPTRRRKRSVETTGPG